MKFPDIYIDEVKKALAFSGQVLRYQTRDGEIVAAIRPDDLNSEMRGTFDNRWKRFKNNSGFDWMDYRDAGFRIAEAQYVNGAHPTGRFVKVVVAEGRIKK